MYTELPWSTSTATILTSRGACSASRCPCQQHQKAFSMLDMGNPRHYLGSGFWKHHVVSMWCWVLACLQWQHLKPNKCWPGTIAAICEISLQLTKPSLQSLCRKVVMDRWESGNKIGAGGNLQPKVRRAPRTKHQSLCTCTQCHPPAKANKWIWYETPVRFYPTCVL